MDPRQPAQRRDPAVSDASLQRLGATHVLIAVLAAGAAHVAYQHLVRFDAGCSLCSSPCLLCLCRWDYRMGTLIDRFDEHDGGWLQEERQG